MVGALLLAISPLLAQTGSVRIRVTDALGTAIPKATVSLTDGWDRKVGNLSTNDAGEVLWPDLPVSDAHFYALAPGFGRLRITVTIRAGDEQQVAAVLEVGPLEVGQSVETVQMPYSETPDLTPELSPSPPQPKASKRHWWQILF